MNIGDRMKVFNQNRGNKMKIIKFCLLAIASTTLFSLKVQATGNTIQTNACMGYQVACDQSLNAVGDRLPFDIRGLPVTNLGTITSKKRVNIIIPEANKASVVKVTFSEGNFAGQEMELLFYNFKTKEMPDLLPPNLYTEAKAMLKKHGAVNGLWMVKLYRRLVGLGEELWTEMGTSGLSPAAAAATPVLAPITMSPNGDADISELSEENAPGTKVYLGAMV